MNPATHYQHPQALVESPRIGRGTRIWAFAHVLPGAMIGEDCNICDGVFVENEAIVGNRVTIKCGVQIWDGVHLEDDVFVGPNATFTNDSMPRSRASAWTLARTLVQRGASIGANATILPGLTIGPGAMVGAGSVVTRDVPANAIVAGNPARIVGYVGAKSDRPSAPASQHAGECAPPLRVAPARLIKLPTVVDLRGALSFAEVEKQLPFVARRFFLVYDVPGPEVRGEHAHKSLHEFFVCLRGACTVMLDDGTVREEVRLNSPSVGLYIPPQFWRVHYQYTADAMALVLASHEYDANDYVRDYDDFLALAKVRNRPQ